MKVTVSAHIPIAYADALHEWAHSNLDPKATRSDALRHLIAVAVELPSLPSSFEAEGEKVELQRGRNDRAEWMASMRADGDTYVQIAQKAGISAGRVRQILAIYERSAR